VLIEGVPDDASKVPILSVKAYKVSEDIVRRREALHGGSMTSRYPSALDALGCHPDLPWIFIDARLRYAMGLGGQKLGTVRIRGRRTYQLTKELRELTVLLVVAFFGLITVVESPVWRNISLLALVLSMVAISAIRMRSRFTQMARIRTEHRAGRSLASLRNRRTP
jgi:hypothetical protein